MTPEKRDELALLAHSFAKISPNKTDAKRTVAGLFDVTEDTAWALIVRGQTLAKAAERAA